MKMDDRSLNIDCSLFCCIVNHGVAEKVMKAAKLNGIKGGTIFLGRGTIHNRLLEFLELNDVRKEIVLIVGEKEKISDVADILNREFEFSKPRHGISFIIPLSAFCGYHGCVYERVESEGVVKKMYKSIFTVVEKGKAEEVIEAAQKAGSKGGTIINARGSGIHETQKLFNMDIEPEKEIVLILAEENVTEAIVKSINENLQIDEPGKGILFVVDVAKAYGLY